jgi:hypothetical protein
MQGRTSASSPVHKKRRNPSSRFRVAFRICLAFTAGCDALSPETAEEPTPIGHTRLCFSTDLELEAPETEHDDHTFTVVEHIGNGTADAPEAFLECSEEMLARAGYIDDLGRRVWMGVDVTAFTESAFAGASLDIIPADALDLATGSSVQIMIAHDSRGPVPTGFAVLTNSVPVLVVQSHDQPESLDLGPIGASVGAATETEITTDCATVAPALLELVVDGSTHTAENGETVALTVDGTQLSATNIHTIQREARADVECADARVWTTSSWVLVK